MVEEKFQLFRTFYITRSALECRLVFGAIHKRQIINPEHLYKNTIGNFENFCIDFLDNSIETIKLNNPNYARSIILNDKYYRRSVIKGLYEQENKLTEREIECLYWAAHGKSSEETASILKIKKTTIDEHKRNIKKKLNSSNLAQAVYEAIKRGYIGALNKIQL